MVLLVSKLAGYPGDFPFKEVEFDKDTGILKDQRVLAESVEITSSANEIHRDGILNMQHYNLNGMSLDNDNLLVFGNKVCVKSFFVLFFVLKIIFCLLSRWPY